MIGVALLFDGILFAAQWLNGIVFIGTLAQLLVTALVSTWAWLTFYLWFKLHGVNFLGPKRIAVFPLAAIIKEIPVVGALPAWSAAVLFLFSTTRAEELLEKAGPLGALAAKKLAAKTQGVGGLVRSQKSEAEKAPKQNEKGGTPSTQSGRVPPRLSDVRSPA